MERNYTTQMDAARALTRCRSRAAGRTLPAGCSPQSCLKSGIGDKVYLSLKKTPSVTACAVPAPSWREPLARRKTLSP